MRFWTASKEIGMGGMYRFAKKNKRNIKKPSTMPTVLRVSLVSGLGDGVRFLLVEKVSDFHE